MLGSTGKVIRPTNQNNGVASVALVTLQKLVVPLKILNINDRELVLLKEIVLFNPGNSLDAVSRRLGGVEGMLHRSGEGRNLLLLP